MRAPVERLVSAFSFGNEPHSPPCARRSEQTKQKVQECFTTMAQAQGFRNVAGRAYTGHDAYAADVSVCRDGDGPGGRGTSDGGGGGGAEEGGGMERKTSPGAAAGGGGDGDRGSGGGDDGDGDGDGGGGDAVGGISNDSCEETLSSSLAGLCLFNHVALAEAPGTSTLLLLETLPWVRPDAKFFSGLVSPRVGPLSEGERVLADLRDTASALNQARRMTCTLH
ncbi:unnamed protein product [Hapterophycus canaliculatus]